MTCTLAAPVPATLHRLDGLLAAARTATLAMKTRTAEVTTATAEFVAAAMSHAAAVAGLTAAAARVAVECQAGADALEAALNPAAPKPAPEPPADRSETVSHALNGVKAGIAPDDLTRPGPLVRAALEAARRAEEDGEEEESDCEFGNPVGAHPAEQQSRAEPDGVGELAAREWPEVPLPAREADPGVVDWICGDDEPLGVPAPNQTPAENATKPTPKKRGNRKR